MHATRCRRPAAQQPPPAVAVGDAHDERAGEGGAILTSAAGARPRLSSGDQQPSDGSQSEQARLPPRAAATSRIAGQRSRRARIEAGAVDPHQRSWAPGRVGDVSVTRRRPRRRAGCPGSGATRRDEDDGNAERAAALSMSARSRRPANFRRASANAGSSGAPRLRLPKKVDDQLAGGESNSSTEAGAMPCASACAQQGLGDRGLAQMP